MESDSFQVNRSRMVVLWLFLCSGMVFAMVLLGGAVRLTGSGLSMVEWKPLMGIVPPLSELAWGQVFEKYKQYPEYQWVNQGMDLASFQFIYLMEYFHRIMGRLIGVVFAVPFFYWLIRGALPSWMIPRLWIALSLGACQGLLGWYMVMSGLVDDPYVSQYRLTAHLMLAVFIFAWLMMLAFRLQGQPRSLVLPLRQQRRLYRQTGLVIMLVLMMIATGGFMAGMKAGFIYNTWPMMGNHWMPDQVWQLWPWWRNVTENPLGIQFVHRWLAFVVLLVVSGYGWSVVSRSSDRAVNMLCLMLIASVLIQVGLGIATLIHQVPLVLGVIHQAGALVVLTLLLALQSRFGNAMFAISQMAVDQDQDYLQQAKGYSLD